ncbi:hypothetical protein J6590_041502 [Homalodisca vitripennis]|nr:hypothetical protein J6590_041502 [Homalodisca vitripennis]
MKFTSLIANLSTILAPYKFGHVNCVEIVIDLRVSRSLYEYYEKLVADGSKYGSNRCLIPGTVEWSTIPPAGLQRDNHRPKDSMWSSARRCAVAYWSCGVEGEVASSDCELVPLRRHSPPSKPRFPSCASRIPHGISWPVIPDKKCS